ncbi:MAG: dihydroorotate dehydrogenase electron transfer subunit [Bacteroidetes bacterium]|uniref:Dihydroorotate dehydrogenase B (NAD(+)), electron transfer subunit n=1 Tax=Candidatus Gallipaludibacter merdavium TaxID=2840839 RepID=A0A9D9HSK3_9BACT|nr:dihydroorotate dehydrogenase electron transfer subunit [Candidatus Gallipaludibacter merdavium]
MKKILDTTLVAVEWLNAKNVLLTLTASQQMPEMLPGQFVEVRIDNAPDVFLRRPISIHFFDPQKNLLYLMVQVVGKGTKRMAALNVGDVLNLILPLGNTFSIPESPQRLLLVGGGVGVAPLLYLGAELKKKVHRVTFLLGARTANDLLRMEAFKGYGDVYVTTEDASLGEKGFVTQHSLLQQQNFDFIYTCGPTPMMQAVARYAKEKGIPCEASLENTMACGLGACLCCVTDTQHGHKCVCSDGPIFNINELKW